MVYAYLGYLEGVCPPNERRGSPKDVAFLGAQLLRMHLAGYQALKAVRPDTDVCIATHVRRFMPARNHWPLDVATAYFVDHAFVLDFVDAIESGVWRPTQTGVVEEIPGLRGTQDTIGLNYYGRSYVRTGLRPGT
jgi:beta-glucosidase/6-phospho-beta-glucosidase/beta-galactosidase